ncbi:MAG: hypothetical protein ACL93V_14625 [Candidatus Electrothrix sp. YB6]
MKSGRKIIVLLTTVFLMTGCSSPILYKKPLTDFQTASTIVIDNARTAYNTVNRKARNAEIDRRVNRGEEITVEVLGEEDLIVIKKEDLQARMAALDALTEHGRMLIELANSDAPERTGAAVNSFDDAVLKLTDSLDKASSDQFKRKAGAFATIAGEVSKLVMAKKIEKALDKAIRASEKHVSALIELLRDDIVVRLPALQRIRLHGARIAAADVYNKILEDSPDDLEKLKSAATGIKKAEDAWEDFLSFPDPGFEKMAEAHKNLVKYAKGSKNPKNMIELVAVMNEFADQAKIIAGAMKELQ